MKKSYLFYFQQIIFSWRGVWKRFEKLGRSIEYHVFSKRRQRMRLIKRLLLCSFFLSKLDLDYTFYRKRLISQFVLFFEVSEWSIFNECTRNRHEDWIDDIKRASERKKIYQIIRSYCIKNFFSHPNLWNFSDWIKFVAERIIGIIFSQHIIPIQFMINSAVLYKDPKKMHTCHTFQVNLPCRDLISSIQPSFSERHFLRVLGFGLRINSIFIWKYWLRIACLCCEIEFICYLFVELVQKEKSKSSKWMYPG